MKLIIIASLDDSDVETLRRCYDGQYRVRRAKDKKTFVKLLRNQHPELAFLDIRFFANQQEPLTQKAYKEEMNHLWEASAAGPIIILSPPSLLREAVKAVKAGASNYLSSPIEADEVCYVTESLQEFDRVHMELDYLRGRLGVDNPEQFYQTKSPLMNDVYQKIKTVAPTKTTVLLTGETGVGKSTWAKIIHSYSTRSDKPFISVHCGAIPDTLIESELFGHEKGSFTGAVRRKLGKFEIAHGGTIFLDEVGLLTSAAQIKLLSVIQERCFQRVGGEHDIHVDVRIIAATNIQLQELCSQREFRKDLYYRLSVFPIDLPALRQRKDDIPLLVDIFLKRLADMHLKTIDDVDPMVMKALTEYAWPGNVRELENLIERAFILESSSTLSSSSFPAELFLPQVSPSLVVDDGALSLSAFRRRHVETLERQYLDAVLRKNRGRINESAKMAGIGVRQLHKLMTKYHLNKESYR